MINYIKEAQTMELTCDICPASVEYDGTWQECIEQAKIDGWKFVKKSDDWYHGCSVECGDKI
jgi:hypothetical protein